MTTNLPVDKLDTRLLCKALVFYRNAALTLGGDAWEIRRSAVLVEKARKAERAVIMREQKRAAGPKKTRPSRKGRQRGTAPPGRRGRGTASGRGRRAA